MTARLSPDEEEAERKRLRAIISHIQDGSFAGSGRPNRGPVSKSSTGSGT